MVLRTSSCFQCLYSVGRAAEARGGRDTGEVGSVGGGWLSSSRACLAASMRGGSGPQEAATTTTTHSQPATVCTIVGAISLYPKHQNPLDLPWRGSISSSATAVQTPSLSPLNNTSNTDRPAPPWSDIQSYSEVLSFPLRKTSHQKAGGDVIPYQSNVPGAQVSLTRLTVAQTIGAVCVCVLLGL